MWYERLDIDFFSRGIKELEERRKKCIEIRGEYIINL
jgi:hypothetical protein